MVAPRGFVLMAILVALGCPAAAHAQFPEAVQAGARVRVWVPEPYLQKEGPWRRQQLRGVVGGIAGDTLLLTVPGTDGALAVPLGSMTRLDVSRGRPSRVASAVERALGYAVAGAIITALHNDPDGPWPSRATRSRAAVDGALIGAVFGAGFGLILPTERWRRVRLGR